MPARFLGRGRIIGGRDSVSKQLRNVHEIAGNRAVARLAYVAGDEDDPPAAAAGPLILPETLATHAHDHGGSSHEWHDVLGRDTDEQEERSESTVSSSGHDILLLPPVSGFKLANSVAKERGRGKEQQPGVHTRARLRTASFAVAFLIVLAGVGFLGSSRQWPNTPAPLETSASSTATSEAFADYSQPQPSVPHAVELKNNLAVQAVPVRGGAVSSAAPLSALPGLTWSLADALGVAHFTPDKMAPWSDRTSEAVRVQFAPTGGKSWTDKRVSHPLSTSTVVMIAHKPHTMSVLAIGELGAGANIFKDPQVILFFNGDKQHDGKLMLRVCGDWYDVRAHIRGGEMFGLRYSSQGFVSVIAGDGAVTKFVSGQMASVVFAAKPSSRVYCGVYHSGQVLSLLSIRPQPDTSSTSTKNMTRFDSTGCPADHTLSPSGQGGVCGGAFGRAPSPELLPGLARIDMTEARGCALDGCKSCQIGFTICESIRNRCVPAHFPLPLKCIACRRASVTDMGQLSTLQRELGEQLNAARSAFVKAFNVKHQKHWPKLVNPQCDAFGFMEPFMAIPMPHELENFSVGIIQFTYDKTAPRVLRQMRQRKALFGESPGDWSSLLMYKHEFDALPTPSNIPLATKWSNPNCGLPHCGEQGALKVLDGAWDLLTPYDNGGSSSSSNSGGGGGRRSNIRGSGSSSTANSGSTTVFRLFLEHRGLQMVMGRRRDVALLTCVASGKAERMWGPVGLFQFIPSRFQGRPTLLIRSVSANQHLSHTAYGVVADRRCRDSNAIAVERACHFQVKTLRGDIAAENKTEEDPELGIAINLLTAEHELMLSWGQDADSRPVFRPHPHSAKAMVSAVRVSAVELESLNKGLHTEERWNPTEREVGKVYPVQAADSGFRHNHQGYTGAQYKFLLGIKYAVEQMPPTDWLLAGDDDMAVVPPFLRREIALLQTVLVKRKTPALPVGLGQLACGRDVRRRDMGRPASSNLILCGGGGILLSRALVEQMYASLEQSLQLQTAHPQPMDVWISKLIPSVAQGVMVNSMGMNSQPPSFYNEEFRDPAVASERSRSDRGYHLKVNAVNGMMNPLSSTFHYMTERYVAVLLACMRDFMAVEDHDRPAVRPQEPHGAFAVQSTGIITGP